MNCLTLTLKKKYLIVNNGRHEIGDYKELLGLTKSELKKQFGFSYNDAYSNVWMYYLHTKFRLTKYNYLYLIFEDNKVKSFHLKRFKTQKFSKLFDK